MRGQICRVCHCSDDDCGGCITKTGEPCYWVEEDLCGACAGFPPPSSMCGIGEVTPTETPGSAARAISSTFEIPQAGEEAGKNQ